MRVSSPGRSIRNAIPERPFGIGFREVPMVGEATRSRLADGAMDLMRWLKVATAETIAAHGVHNRTLTDLVREGGLERPVRGVYVLAEPFGEADLVRASILRLAVPEGVICLRGAARLHGMHDNDTPVWTVAVGHKRPVRVPERTRVVRWSNPRFMTEGVVECEGVAGITFRVTDPARTVADMFRKDHHRDYGGGRAVSLAEAQDTLAAYVSGGGSLSEAGRCARVLGYGEDVAPYLKGAMAAGGNGAGFISPLKPTCATPTNRNGLDGDKSPGDCRAVHRRP